jgi:thioredoxin 1
MLKTLVVLATLTFLASCTTPVSTPTSPAPDAMMQKETIPKDTVMPDDKMMSGSDSMMQMDDKMIMATGAMMQKETPKMNTSMKKESGYQIYTPELVASALQSWQKVALFFHAGWCPSCKALDRAITADLGSIGADTLIVRVDYDNSTELKKKYGVVTQHTTVILSVDGSTGTKKLGARTVAEVIGE